MQNGYTPTNKLPSIEDIGEIFYLAARIEDVIEQYLKSIDVAEESKHCYRKRIRAFFRWCQKHPQPIRKETLIEYKRDLTQRRFSPMTIGAYLVALRGFFAWTETVGVHPNVARGVRVPKKPKGFRKDPLTVKQVHRLLASIDRTTLKGKRDFALLNLLLRTGPRAIEIVRADVGDIRLESGETVLWLQGKGAEAKDAFVVLTDAALQPIQEYLAFRGTAKESEPLFGSTSDSNRHQRMTTRSIRRIVKERLRGVQLDSPRLSSHSGRHTAITLALRSGAPLQEVQQMARHANINTTLIYAHNLRRASGIPEKKIEELLGAD